MLDDSTVVDRALRALSDSSRRQMVERLSHGPASVSELARPFAMSLAAVVQHVQVLEANGLVHSEKSGRIRVCRLRPEALLTVERWAADRRAEWETRLDRLGDYLQHEQLQHEQNESNEQHDQKGSTS